MISIYKHDETGTWIYIREEEDGTIVVETWSQENACS